MALEVVLATLVTQIDAAINSAGITQPGQVGIGWPAATELVNLLAQNNLQWQVSVYPLPGARNVTRYIGDAGGALLTAPSFGLTCAISGGAATFSGTTTDTVNVHGFLVGQNADAFVQLPQGTDAAAAAAAFANAITALALSGITASASSNAVTVTGATFKYVNLGGNGTMAQEIGRICQGVQVSIWAPADPNSTVLPGLPLTYPIGDAIISRVGQKTSLRYTMPDGTQMRVMYRSEYPSDESQSSYSLYVRHIIYDVEYPIISTWTVTTVGSFHVASQTDQQSPTTSVFGGP